MLDVNIIFDINNNNVDKNKIIDNKKDNKYDIGKILFFL